MFNMTQIDGRIQKNLFNRIQLLNRESVSDALSPIEGNGASFLHDALSRTCWVRVISAVPDVRDNLRGYKTHYSELFRLSSAFNYNEEEEAGSYTPINEPLASVGGFSQEGGVYRPHSGITSISTDFQDHSIQNITINWKFYNMDDFNRYKNALLTHGRAVLVEFGWGSPITSQYQDQTNNPATMLEYFESITEKILNRGGDYYAASGIISGYNWDVVEGGGFECTTTLTSMGTSIFKSQIDKTLDSMYIDVKSQTRAKTLESAYNRANLTFGTFMSQLNETIGFFAGNCTDDVDVLSTDVLDDNVLAASTGTTPMRDLGNMGEITGPIRDPRNDPSPGESPSRTALIEKINSEDAHWELKHIRYHAELIDKRKLSGDDFLLYMLNNHTNEEIFPRKLLLNDKEEIRRGYLTWKATLTG